MRAIVRVHLRPQRSSQNKLSNCTSKATGDDVRVSERCVLPPCVSLPRQERVKRKVGHEYTVQELDDSRDHNEHQESVNEF